MPNSKEMHVDDHKKEREKRKSLEFLHSSQFENVDSVDLFTTHLQYIFKQKFPFDLFWH